MLTTDLISGTQKHIDFQMITGGKPQLAISRKVRHPGNFSYCTCVDVGFSKQKHLAQHNPLEHFPKLKMTISKLR